MEGEQATPQVEQPTQRMQWTVTFDQASTTVGVSGTAASWDFIAAVMGMAARACEDAKRAALEGGKGRIALSPALDNLLTMRRS